jgi:sugar lactone lactonase YvrE
MPASTSYRRCLPALALVAGLAGCAGQPATGAFVPAATGAAGMPASGTPVRSDGSFRPDAGVRIFTANRDRGDVLAFLTNANGNVAPAIKIGGSNTGLNDPDALALDTHGNVYAADDGGTKVEEFSEDANGNVKPSRVIGGSKSHLGPTEGLLVDHSGNLWASDYANQNDQRWQYATQHADGYGSGFGRQALRGKRRRIVGRSVRERRPR